MEPTLRPGDWLLVDPDAHRGRAPAAGELVVVIDPRAPARWLIKRVVGVAADGALALGGDNPAHAREATLETVPPSSVTGRPWLRYWPPRRISRIG
jgi:signal peptidase I